MDFNGMLTGLDLFYDSNLGYPIHIYILCNFLPTVIYQVT